MKNIFLLLLFFTNFLAIAHPFYKTMPKELEHIYNELKRKEQEAIDAFKNTYSKVPKHFWEDVYFLSTQTQSWLRDTALVNNTIKRQTNTPEKSLLHFKNLVHNECKRFKNLVHNECKRQEIDYTKINFKIKSINDPFSYEIYGATVDVKQVNAPKDFDYEAHPGTTRLVIDSQDKFTLTFKPSALVNMPQYVLIHAVNHEIAHFTEAHGTKAYTIESLINAFYNEEELMTETYKKLMLNLQQIHELTADVVAVLNDPQSATTLINTINPSFQGHKVHSTNQNFIQYLKKIIAVLQAIKN